MRRSTRGYYEITGTAVRQADEPAPAGDTAATWQERRGDLVEESTAIARVHHTLTAEENGLWNAIQRELVVVDAAIAHPKPDGG